MTAALARGHILVVDDSADTRELLQRNLAMLGYDILSAANVPDALRILETTPVDLVVTDLKMPGASGLDLIKHVRENLRDTGVMMITGYASVEGAVAAVKLGAEEYLPKPFTRDELIAAVTRALERQGVKRAGSGQAQWQVSSRLGIIGESEPMQAVFRAVSAASTALGSVLITGENATGKEMVARAIHYAGEQSGDPFFRINCVDSPEESLDELLFGRTDRPDIGMWRQVGHGTLYFDEVSGLPVTVQTKVMQAIREMSDAAGEQTPTSGRCRIIAGTCKDLRPLVRSGSFREDLLFHLGATAVSMPPLRERGNDILLLARHYLDKFAAEVGRPAPEFTEQALDSLRTYAWPGNIGELQSLMLRLVTDVTANVIDTPDFPPLMRSSVAAGAGFNRSLADVEAEHIRKVMAGVGGNKTQAAEILGITRKTLREKLKQDDLLKRTGGR